MKRQICYAILAYAAWLTYQDINGTLQDTNLEGMQPLLRQAVAQQVGDAKSLSAYRNERETAACVDPYACNKAGNKSPEQGE
ncbi:hypothetical protein SHAM105786_13235 [Shewanella amazonensis]|uniref:Uncharacterized protein n=1 Tax=Shewanella amazonensis (strain ATCC BAA-1098 / SB2B) TaxID=326297 RepID=A1SBG0_SHEAM|nr:hypothetical protein [Shewanella amazonensis]ABM01717.1 hypothetical protein Sama_3514 [Shewanella amazonensis SB2B]